MVGNEAMARLKQGPLDRIAGAANIGPRFGMMPPQYFAFTEQSINLAKPSDAQKYFLRDNFVFPRPMAKIYIALSQN